MYDLVVAFSWYIVHGGSKMGVPLKHPHLIHSLVCLCRYSIDITEFLKVSLSHFSLFSTMLPLTSCL